jgi:hypothetical protein
MIIQAVSMQIAIRETPRGRVLTRPAAASGLNCPDDDEKKVPVWEAPSREAFRFPVQMEIAAISPRSVTASVVSLFT